MLDKLAILSICLIGICDSESYMLPVIALLTAVTASSSAQILTGKRSACIIIMVWAAICGIFPGTVGRKYP